MVSLSPMNDILGDEIKANAPLSLVRTTLVFSELSLEDRLLVAWILKTVAVNKCRDCDPQFQFSAVIMMSHQCWRRFIEMALTYTRLLAGYNWNWSTWCMNEWRSVRQLFSPRRTNGIQCAINNFYSFRLSLNILDESVFVTRILRRIVTHSEIRLV